jgi:hypothetical protein
MMLKMLRELSESRDTVRGTKREECESLLNISLVGPCFFMKVMDYLK